MPQVIEHTAYSGSISPRKNRLESKKVVISPNAKPPSFEKRKSNGSSGTKKVVQTSVIEHVLDKMKTMSLASKEGQHGSLELKMLNYIRQLEQLAIPSSLHDSYVAVPSSSMAKVNFDRVNQARYNLLVISRVDNILLKRRALESLVLSLDAIFTEDAKDVTGTVMMVSKLTKAVQDLPEDLISARLILKAFCLSILRFRSLTQSIGASNEVKSEKLAEILQKAEVTLSDISKHDLGSDAQILHNAFLSLCYVKDARTFEYPTIVNMCTAYLAEVIGASEKFELNISNVLSLIFQDLLSANKIQEVVQAFEILAAASSFSSHAAQQFLRLLYDVQKQNEDLAITGVRFLGVIAARGCTSLTRKLALEGFTWASKSNLTKLNYVPGLFGYAGVEGLPHFDQPDRWRVREAAWSSLLAVYHSPIPVFKNFKARLVVELTQFKRQEREARVLGTLDDLERSLAPELQKSALAQNTSVLAVNIAIQRALKFKENEHHLRLFERYLERTKSESRYSQQVLQEMKQLAHQTETLLTPLIQIPIAKDETSVSNEAKLASIPYHNRWKLQ